MAEARYAMNISNINRMKHTLTLLTALLRAACTILRPSAIVSVSGFSQ